MKARIWLIVLSSVAILAAGAWLILWGMDEYAQRQADGLLRSGGLFRRQLCQTDLGAGKVAQGLGGGVAAVSLASHEH